MQNIIAVYKREVELFNNLNEKWTILLNRKNQKETINNLELFLKKEYKEQKIYPKSDEVFNLFNHLSIEKIKVVILGQDPYHGEGQGNGIAFSVKEGVRIPPSLRNIFKELKLEYPNYTIPESGNLMKWVEQGVFLLNTVLTVREGDAFSHKGKGWEILTDKIIEIIDEKDEPVVFILWGNSAKKKKELIKNSKNLILEGVHPSPLAASRGFFGCNHFLKVNEFLKKNKIKPIEWSLE